MNGFKAAFIDAGNDYAAALERVAGDEELLCELMQMFLADENWSEIKTAAEAGECERAFRAAHSLKGSSGMLGMNGLYGAMVKLTDEFRHGNLQSGRDLIPETEKEYTAIVELIKEYL